jgi:uncharacterized membrane protein YjfL (UPF0719 family)
MNNGNLVQALIAAGAFSMLGIVLMGAVFFVIVKLSPFSVRKEIEEDQNISLAILIGSIMLAIGVIVGAAVHA